MQQRLDSIHRSIAPILVEILVAVARRKVSKSALSRWSKEFRRVAELLDEDKSESRSSSEVRGSVDDDTRSNDY